MLACGTKIRLKQNIEEDWPEEEALVVKDFCDGNLLVEDMRGNLMDITADQISVVFTPSVVEPMAFVTEVRYDDRPGKAGPHSAPPQATEG